MVELPDKNLFNVEEVAAIFGVTTRTVRAMVANDELPAIYFRNSVRISRKTLSLYLVKNTRKQRNKVGK